MKQYAQEYVVIDADGHGGPTTQENYLPKKFRNRTGWIDDPTGIPRPDGRWGRAIVEGVPMPKGKGKKVGFQGPVSAGPWKEYGQRRGEYDPKVRLEDMDLEGIDVTVLFFGLGQAGLKDKEYAIASCRASNDAYAADYCSIDPKRVKATVALPLQDVAASVKELHRVVTKHGFVGACVPTNVRGKNLAHKDFWPLFEEAERLNVPVCFHIGPGVSEGIKEAGMERLDNYFYTHTLSFPFENQIALTTLVGEGVLERFPRLRFGFMESGCGWLPFLIERLDEHFERLPVLVPNMKHKPSVYIKESGQVFVATEPDEKGLPYVLEAAGEGNIVYASDYCHWDCDFPNSVRDIAERSDLSDEAKRKVLAENAARLYGFNGT